jgi:hypothetical protein
MIALIIIGLIAWWIISLGLPWWLGILLFFGIMALLDN